MEPVLGPDLDSRGGLCGFMADLEVEVNGEESGPSDLH